MSSVWLGKGDNIYLNSFCFGYRPSIKFDPYYLAYYLRSSSFRQEITILAQGISRFNISKNKVLELYINLPQLEEQKLIGRYFKALDQSITLHQRKFFNCYMNFQLILINLFYSWEQRKLDEIAIRLDNLRIPVSESKRIKGETPYYGANGIQDYVSGFTHDGENILVAEDGANDLDNYPVYYVKGRIWVNNHAHVLKTKENFSPKFLKYSFSKIDMESILVGGSRSKLNANILMNLTFKVPSYFEQQKIGVILDHIDNLITLHQRQEFSIKDKKFFVL